MFARDGKDSLGYQEIRVADVGQQIGKSAQRCDAAIYRLCISWASMVNGDRAMERGER